MASKKQRISCNAAKCSELERLVQGWLWWSTAEHSWLEHWINDALVQALIVPFVPSASRFTLSICTLLFSCPEVFWVWWFFLIFFFPRIQHKCQHLAFIRKQAPVSCSRESQKNPVRGGFLRSASNSLCRLEGCGIIQTSCTNLWSSVFICLWNAITAAAAAAIRPGTSLPEGIAEFEDPTQVKGYEVKLSQDWGCSCRPVMGCGAISKGLLEHLSPPKLSVTSFSHGAHEDQASKPIGKIPIYICASIPNP